jgi:hypothetical protein
VVAGRRGAPAAGARGRGGPAARPPRFCSLSACGAPRASRTWKGWRLRFGGGSAHQMAPLGSLRRGRRPWPLPTATATLRGAALGKVGRQERSGKCASPARIRTGRERLFGF